MKVMEIMPSEGLRVAWVVRGGLGDALQAMPFIQRFNDTFRVDRLALYKDAERVDSVGRIIVDCLPAQAGPYREEDLEGDIATGLYDLQIDIRRVPKYTVLNAQRIQAIRPALWQQIKIAQKRFKPLEFIFDHHAFYDGLFGRLMADYDMTVVDAMLYFGGYGDSQASKPRITVASSTREEVQRFGLPTTGYIVVHDGFDVFNGLAGVGKRPTRAWPRAYWEKLIAHLKQARPDLQIVQIGATESSEYFHGTDHYLLGATSMDEAICLIDGADLHIDTEGGFVACAWALGTPAISVQGPTGSYFYHYDGVRQIFDSHCHGCWWSTPDWMENCARGLDRAECMHRVTPEMVLEDALKLLSGQSTSKVNKLKVWGETVWSSSYKLPPLDIATGQLDSVFWRGRREAEKQTRDGHQQSRSVLSLGEPEPVVLLLDKDQFFALMKLGPREFVTAAYRTILKREPDEGGLEHYTAVVQNGELTKAEVLKVLLRSDESRKVLPIPSRRQANAAFAAAAARLLRAHKGTFPALLEDEVHGHSLFIKAMSLKQDEVSKRTFLRALQYHPPSPTQGSAVGASLATSGMGLRIAVFVAGSLGDMLQQVPFINAFSTQFQPSMLDMYFYRGKQEPGKFAVQCIEGARGPFISDDLEEACLSGKYDLRIDMKHLVKYHALAPDRIKKHSPRLFEIIANAEQRLLRYEFMLEQHPIFDGLFGRLMAKYGMNAVEATGFLGGIRVSRADVPKIRSEVSVVEVLERFGLAQGRYLVLHDGFDVDHYMVGAAQRPTKVWPTSHWERLVQLIKVQHPDLKIVQIGHSASSTLLRGVDKDLIGKTSLNELVAVLEQAAVVVTSEGGILRLAWALDVPTISLQGPSGSEFFHFGKVNTVISNTCNGCWFVLDEWMARCYRGYRGPICMNGIRPEAVAAELKNICPTA